MGQSGKTLVTIMKWRNKQNTDINKSHGNYENTNIKGIQHQTPNSPDNNDSKINPSHIHKSTKSQ